MKWYLPCVRAMDSPTSSSLQRSLLKTLRALDIDELPHADEYETLAGFLMVMLRRVPRRTDKVTWQGYAFEVLDVDSYRVDQVMVTRLGAEASPSPANT